MSNSFKNKYQASPGQIKILDENRNEVFIDPYEVKIHNKKIGDILNTISTELEIQKNINKKQNEDILNLNKDIQILKNNLLNALNKLDDLSSFIVEG